MTYLNQLTNYGGYFYLNSGANLNLDVPKNLYGGIAVYGDATVNMHFCEPVSFAKIVSCGGNTDFNIFVGEGVNAKNAHILLSGADNVFVLGEANSSLGNISFGTGAATGLFGSKVTMGNVYAASSANFVFDAGANASIYNIQASIYCHNSVSIGDNSKITLGISGGYCADTFSIASGTTIGTSIVTYGVGIGALEAGLGDHIFIGDDVTITCSINMAGGYDTNQDGSRAGLNSLTIGDGVSTHSIYGGYASTDITIGDDYDIQLIKTFNDQDELILGDSDKATHVYMNDGEDALTLTDPSGQYQVLHGGWQGAGEKDVLTIKFTDENEYNYWKQTLSCNFGYELAPILTGHLALN